MSMNGFRVFCAFFVVQAIAALTLADAAARYDGPVVVCPDKGESAPPSFDGSDCWSEPIIYVVDPQDRSLWVQVPYSLDKAALSSTEPAGVFFSAKASSAVWLNGTFLGANGRPSAEKAREDIGRMDSVFYAPADVLRDGDNEIAIRLSSHHGYIKLAFPVHGVTIRAYEEPARVFLAFYGRSILTFGVFIAGALYFATASARAEEKWPVALLALTSAMAGGQLLAEVARGGFGYAYPIHDLRLIVIFLLSGGIGITLCAYVAVRTSAQRARLILIGVTVATIILTAVTRGFDSKSIIAFLLPATTAMALATWHAVKAQEKEDAWPRAKWVAGGLAALIGIAIIRPTAFLDANFFFALAAVLLFLFVQEARTLAEERKGRRAESARAERLSQALDDALRRKGTQRLTLKDGGSTVYASPRDIIACSGAGDYVDVRLAGERQILHAGTLSDLEKALPSNFLRVHRSHLVNLDCVKSLVRTASGTGNLEVTEGDPLPVSRRIMPQVSASLNDNNETAQSA